TRIASAAALANGLAEAVTHFWPGAASGGARIAIVTGSLAFLVAINIIGVRAAARTGVVLAIARVVPLLMFIAIGAMFADLSQAAVLANDIPLRDLGEAALLLLFAYARSEERRVGKECRCRRERYPQRKKKEGRTRMSD